jgi:hypothetical protein
VERKLPLALRERVEVRALAMIASMVLTIAVIVLKENKRLAETAH